MTYILPILDLGYCIWQWLMGIGTKIEGKMEFLAFSTRRLDMFLTFCWTTLYDLAFVFAMESPFYSPSKKILCPLLYGDADSNCMCIFWANLAFMCNFSNCEKKKKK